MYIEWYSGTAYDFFMSLEVLHVPKKWDVRRSWAAGIRARLPQPQRDFLAATHALFSTPVFWLMGLPQPASAMGMLNELSKIASAERLPTLAFNAEWDADDPFQMVLYDVMQRHTVTDADVQALRQSGELPTMGYTKKTADQLLAWWADPTAFGDQILPALQAWYTRFFAEEEERIAPLLADVIQNAELTSAETDFEEWLESLTGIVLETPPAGNFVRLIPSFWITPFTLYTPLDGDGHLYFYGARPDHVSLIPGEVVPQALYTALRALADPTRLRIMRLLVAQPQTSAELARQLRLRLPTVTHHLSRLRLARLAYPTLTHEGKRCYTANPQATDQLLNSLNAFLQSK